MEQKLDTLIDGFLETNYSQKISFDLALNINQLNVNKSTVEKIALILETAHRVLPKKQMVGLRNSYFVKPEEEFPTNEPQNKTVWDVGRILIFLSENKNSDNETFSKNARVAYTLLSDERNANDYINYKNYLSWIANEKDSDKITILKQGKSAKTAMIKMFQSEITALASEENKPLIIENVPSDNVVQIGSGQEMVIFSGDEINGSIANLPEDKATKLKSLLKTADIDPEPIVAKKIQINTPRISNGAGKCGDIENAIVEGVAKFIPLNNGEMFLYFSSIGNIYIITDKLVEGEKGGIMFPNVIYSIPRPLLIKLSIVNDLPNNIKGIQKLSIKPVRELASSSRTADTLNQVYNRKTVLNKFKEQLSDLRRNLN